jgi:hypothetical protein
MPRLSVISLVSEVFYWNISIPIILDSSQTWSILSRDIPHFILISVSDPSPATLDNPQGSICGPTLRRRDTPSPCLLSGRDNTVHICKLPRQQTPAPIV